MSKSNNGGPAFPEVFTDHKWSDKHSDYMQDTYSAGGMTLRDYFAAKAMNGMLSRGATNNELGLHVVDYAVLSQRSYSIADAMINARKDPK